MSFWDAILRKKQKRHTKRFRIAVSASESFDGTFDPATGELQLVARGGWKACVLSRESAERLAEWLSIHYTRGRILPFPDIQGGR